MKLGGLVQWRDWQKRSGCFLLSGIFEFQRTSNFVWTNLSKMAYHFEYARVSMLRKHSCRFKCPSNRWKRARKISLSFWEEKRARTHFIGIQIFNKKHSFVRIIIFVVSGSFLRMKKNKVGEEIEIVEIPGLDIRACRAWRILEGDWEICIHLKNLSFLNFEG